MTAVLPADIDAEWLVAWCSPLARAELSPIEAALLDACPVVLDPRQYARAVKHGLGGRIAPVMFESIIFDGTRFRLAQHCEDHRGAEIAFLFPVEDAECELADVAAWVPESGRVATLLGEVGTLGIPRIGDTWLAPPMVHETVMDWMLAGEDGLCVVDPALAAAELEGVTLACPDRAAALRLHSRLSPFVNRAPRIVTPKKAA